MTDAERQVAFYQAIRAAELAYGLTIQAEVKVEQLGEAVLMRPGLTIVPLAGWIPPAPVEQPKGTIDNPLPTPPFEPPKVMNMGTNGTPIPAGVNLAHQPNETGNDNHE